MKELEGITPTAREQLYKTPAYLSLLAASGDGGLDEREKKEAIKQTHIKTYASPPELIGYYAEVEKSFDKEIQEIDAALPTDIVDRKEAIEAELKKIEEIMVYLDPSFVFALHKSLKSYSLYVGKAYGSSVMSFFIPFSIKGLTE